MPNSPSPKGPIVLSDSVTEVIGQGGTVSLCGEAEVKAGYSEKSNRCRLRFEADPDTGLREQIIQKFLYAPDSMLLQPIISSCRSAPSLQSSLS